MMHRIDHQAPHHSFTDVINRVPASWWEKKFKHFPGLYAVFSKTYLYYYYYYYYY